MKPTLPDMIAAIEHARKRLAGKMPKKLYNDLIAAGDYLRGETEDERANANNYIYPDDNTGQNWW